jgi:hypothetical protein
MGRDVEFEIEDPLRCPFLDTAAVIFPNNKIIILCLPIRFAAINRPDRRRTCEEKSFTSNRQSPSRLQIDRPLLHKGDSVCLPARRTGDCAGLTPKKLIVF